MSEQHTETEEQSTPLNSTSNSHSLMRRLLPKPAQQTNVEKRGLFKVDSSTGFLITHIQNEIEQFDMADVNSTNASQALSRMVEQIKQLSKLAQIVQPASLQHKHLIALKLLVVEKTAAIRARYPSLSTAPNAKKNSLVK